MLSIVTHLKIYRKIIARLFPALGMMLITALVLISCSSNRPVIEDSEPAAPTPTSKPAEPTALPTQETEDTIILLEPDWDDRSIYNAGLLPDAQPVLKENLEASVYHIRLDIPTELPAPLNGSLLVRYFNRENEPLDEIYFRLFAYIYGGRLEVDDVRVDGVKVETTLESENTALKVSLKDPLLVGESAVISMNFTLTLPESLSGSYGLLGFFNETLTLDTFYPIIPAYDENGWYNQTPYRNGDPTYQDISYYRVEVNAPVDFVLASSGVEVERVTEGESKKITYAAGPVRDFYLGGSRLFINNSKVVNGVTINSFAQLGQEAGQKAALDAAGNAIGIFSELFGEYPYTEFDIINAPMLALGIEYPGITSIYNELYNIESSGEAVLRLLETVIAHEVGHQWFYNMVGNDQQNQPWLDESVTQYVTYLYVVEKYGVSTAKGITNNWESRLSGLENKKKAVGLAGSEFGPGEYSGIVYGRGPIFFLVIQNAYERQVVVDGLRDYFLTHQWQVGSEPHLRASLQAACECDLSWAFEEFIYPSEEE